MSIATMGGKGWVNGTNESNGTYGANGEPLK